jgi:GDP-L-fucose synthase
MNKSDKIFIAGHNGMVGSAITRKLRSEGYNNLVTRTSAQTDLRNQLAVNDLFAEERPQYVFLAAAKVGGIQANNTYRAQFLYDNLLIEANIIHAAWINKVTKLLFLGSSCIYPKLAPQPLKEEHLLTGLLEPTNEPYAIAYRSQYGCNFISAMPCNLYGPGDNYDLQNSHVIPALIRKFHEATIKESTTVEVWGSGTPMREFLYVDDLAAACYFLMQHYNQPGHINVGTGSDLSIKELAATIKTITGYNGDIQFDATKPDGTPRKLMDVSKLNELGWRASTALAAGLEISYTDFKQRYC